MSYMDLPLPEMPWYLVQFKPNGFQMAARNLKRQTFSVFSPMQEELRKRRGKFVIHRAPLFPGYLFVGVEPDDGPWRAINSTYGVSRLVTTGDNRLKPVPMELIAGLMMRCDEQGLLLPPDKLLPGDEVRLVSGPFADFVTKVESIANDQRVWVLLDILGGATKVAVSVSDLQKV